MRKRYKRTNAARRSLSWAGVQNKLLVRACEVSVEASVTGYNGAEPSKSEI